MKVTKAKNKEGTKKQTKKAALKSSMKVQTKNFVVNHNKIVITFEVLIIGDVSIYDDSAFSSLNLKVAKEVELKLDTQIANHLNVDSMEQIAILE
jgi:hypothetical protein